jgi:hypothetical protein
MTPFICVHFQYLEAAIMTRRRGKIIDTIDHLVVLWHKTLCKSLGFTFRSKSALGNLTPWRTFSWSKVRPASS